MSYYKDQLKSWLAEKDFKSQQVLSVGNMNDDSKYFKSFDVKELLTIDVDPQYKPDLPHDLNLPIETSMISSAYNNYFDDIFTFELWEYIYDPITALKNFQKLLKKDGKLWISAPFLYPTHNPEDADFLRYTEWFWKNIPQKVGYSLIEYKKRVWRNPEGYMASVATDGMRPSKQYRNHDLTGHLGILKKV